LVDDETQKSALKKKDTDHTNGQTQENDGNNSPGIGKFRKGIADLMSMVLKPVLKVISIVASMASAIVPGIDKLVKNLITNSIVMATGIAFGGKTGKYLEHNLDIQPEQSPSKSSMPEPSPQHPEPGAAQAVTYSKNPELEPKTARGAFKQPENFNKVNNTKEGQALTSEPTQPTKGFIKLSEVTSPQNEPARMSRGM